MSASDAPRAGRRLWRGFLRGWRGFRRWRRGRPFWGGLFLALGGLQLFFSTQMSLLDVEISFGSEGFLAIVLPVVLLLCGVLLWATPQHRYFYSIIGALTAVYSLLGLNLGGWFLGMLLGIIGGALGFSWSPVRPEPSEPPDGAADPIMQEPEPEPDPDPGTADDRPTEDIPGLLRDQTPGPEQQAPVRSPRQGPHGYAAVAAPLLLSVALAAPVAAVPTAGAPGQFPCLIPILCPDEEPGEDEEAEPGEQPTPTPGPSGTPAPSPTAEPAPDPGNPDDPEAPAESEPTPTPTEELPTPEPPPPDQPLVAAEPGVMTADRLAQRRFVFEGVTELPARGGPIEVLQFSFSRSTATDFTLTATSGGESTTVTADPLVIAGDVTFYTSRFRGNLFGVLPLDLTPDSPEVDLLELVGIPLPVFFTDVNLELVFTHGAELTATGFALD